MTKMMNFFYKIMECWNFDVHQGSTHIPLPQPSLLYKISFVDDEDDKLWFTKVIMN
jgi:hypothetical protein